jgi:hypothetical protein
MNMKRFALLLAIVAKRLFRLQRQRKLLAALYGDAALADWKDGRDLGDQEMTPPPGPCRSIRNPKSAIRNPIACPGLLTLERLEEIERREEIERELLAGGPALERIVRGVMRDLGNK